MIEIIQAGTRYLVLGLLGNKITKQKWYVSEVGMYPTGIQPMGFGPMPSKSLATMYLSCTQTDPRIQLLQY